MNGEDLSRRKSVPGMLTVDELRERIKAGEIDQVIMSFSDMSGRLLGKRLEGDFFLESALRNGIYCCNYLLVCDVEQQTHPDYTYTNLQRGFGDFHLVPDLTSLRLISWQDKTSNVMCDIYENDVLVPFAPRTILRRQVDAGLQLSFKIFSASELEYFTFENSYHDARAMNYQQSKLRPVGDYAAACSLLQMSHEEKYTSLFRKHLKASGVPIESNETEAGRGQHELNVKYTDVFSMADRHVTYKQCLKEIADQLGISITFMAKPFTDTFGSSCHLHLSLVNAVDETNAFTGNEDIPGGHVKCSSIFKHFLAGWMKFTPDMMVFYAPTINSYKRFINSPVTTTHISWSYDNRTVSFRVVGENQSLRIECRIPGADCNIYLAFAAALASGLQGIKDQIQLPPIFDGTTNDLSNSPRLPRTLKDATEIFNKSTFAREAFGDNVVDHYTTFYRNEQAVYEKHVTDWERARYFEQI